MQDHELDALLSHIYGRRGFAPGGGPGIGGGPGVSGIGGGLGIPGQPAPEGPGSLGMPATTQGAIPAGTVPNNPNDPMSFVDPLAPDFSFSPDPSMDPEGNTSATPDAEGNPGGTGQTPGVDAEGNTDSGAGGVGQGNPSGNSPAPGEGGVAPGGAEGDSAADWHGGGIHYATGGMALGDFMEATEPGAFAYGGYADGGEETERNEQPVPHASDPAEERQMLQALGLAPAPQHLDVVPNALGTAASFPDWTDNPSPEPKTWAEAGKSLATHFANMPSNIVKGALGAAKSWSEWPFQTEPANPRVTPEQALMPTVPMSGAALLRRPAVAATRAIKGLRDQPWLGEDNPLYQPPHGGITESDLNYMPTKESNQQDIGETTRKLRAFREFNDLQPGPDTTFHANQRRSSLPAAFTAAGEAQTGQPGRFHGLHGMAGKLENDRFDPEMFGANYGDDTGPFSTTEPAKAHRWAERTVGYKRGDLINDAILSDPEANYATLHGLDVPGAAIVPTEYRLKNPLVVNTPPHHIDSHDPSNFWYDNRHKFLEEARVGDHDGIIIRDPDTGEATLVSLKRNTVFSPLTGNKLYSQQERTYLPGVIIGGSPVERADALKIVHMKNAGLGHEEIAERMTFDPEGRGEAWSRDDIDNLISRLNKGYGAPPQRAFSPNWAGRGKPVPQPSVDRIDPWYAHTELGDVSDAPAVAREQAHMNKPPRYIEGEGDLYASGGDVHGFPAHFGSGGVPFVGSAESVGHLSPRNLALWTLGKPLHYDGDADSSDSGGVGPGAGNNASGPDAPGGVGSAGGVGPGGSAEAGIGNDSNASAAAAADAADDAAADAEDDAGPTAPGAPSVVAPGISVAAPVAISPESVVGPIGVFGAPTTMAMQAATLSTDPSVTNYGSTATTSDIGMPTDPVAIDPNFDTSDLGPTTTPGVYGPTTTAPNAPTSPTALQSAINAVTGVIAAPYQGLVNAFGPVLADLMANPPVVRDTGLETIANTPTFSVAANPAAFNAATPAENEAQLSNAVTGLQDDLSDIEQDAEDETAPTAPATKGIETTPAPVSLQDPETTQTAYAGAISVSPANEPSPLGDENAAPPASGHAPGSTAPTSPATSIGTSYSQTSPAALGTAFGASGGLGGDIHQLVDASIAAAASDPNATDVTNNRSNPLSNTPTLRPQSAAGGPQPADSPQQSDTSGSPQPPPDGGPPPPDGGPPPIDTNGLPFPFNSIDSGDVEKNPLFRDIANYFTPTLWKKPPIDNISVFEDNPLTGLLVHGRIPSFFKNATTNVGIPIDTQTNPSNTHIDTPMPLASSNPNTINGGFPAGLIANNTQNDFVSSGGGGSYALGGMPGPVPGGHYAEGTIGGDDDPRGTWRDPDVHERPDTIGPYPYRYLEPDVLKSQIRQMREPILSPDGHRSDPFEHIPMYAFGGMPDPLDPLGLLHHKDKGGHGPGLPSPGMANMASQFGDFGGAGAGAGAEAANAGIAAGGPEAGAGLEGLGALAILADGGKAPSPSLWQRFMQALHEERAAAKEQGHADRDFISEIHNYPASGANEPGSADLETMGMFRRRLAAPGYRDYDPPGFDDAIRPMQRSFDELPNRGVIDFDEASKRAFQKPNDLIPIHDVLRRYYGAGGYAHKNEMTWAERHEPLGQAYYDLPESPVMSPHTHYMADTNFHDITIPPDDIIGMRDERRRLFEHGVHEGEENSGPGLERGENLELEPMQSSLPTFTRPAW